MPFSVQIDKIFRQFIKSASSNDRLVIQHPLKQPVYTAMIVKNCVSVWVFTYYVIKYMHLSLFRGQTGETIGEGGWYVIYGEGGKGNGAGLSAGNLVDFGNKFI